MYHENESVEHERLSATDFYPFFTAVNRNSV